MDDREKTILEIEADVSQIKDLGEAIKAATDTAPIERLTDKTGALDDAMAKLIDHQGDMIGQFKDVDKGAESYSKLADRLEKIGDQAKDAASSLDHLNQKAAAIPAEVMQPAAPGGGMGGGGGLPGPGGAPKDDDGWGPKKIGQGIGHAGMTGAQAVGSPGLGTFGGMMIGGGSAMSAAFGGSAAAVGIPMALLGYALYSAAQSSGAAEQYWTARMGAYPFLGGAGMAGHVFGAGLPFGVSPTQSLMLGQGFYGAIGKGGFLGTEGFDAMLGLRAMGIDPGITASYARTFRPGRGTADWEGDSLGILAGLYGAAARSGMGAGERGEFLSMLSGSVASVGASGNILGYQDLYGLAGGLAGAFGGGSGGLLHGTRVAGQMAQAGLRVGMTGPQDAIDVALMRGAGWAGGGAAGYGKARLDLMDNPAGAWLKALRIMLPKGMNQDFMASQLVDIFGSKGIQIGAPLARGLAASLGGDGLEAEELALGNIQSVIGAGQRIAGEGGGGIPQQRAGIDAYRIGVGSKFLDASFTLEKAAINMGKALVPLTPALNDLANTVVGLTRKFGDAVQWIAETTGVTATPPPGGMPVPGRPGVYRVDSGDVEDLPPILARGATNSPPIRQYR